MQIPLFRLFILILVKTKFISDRSRWILKFKEAKIKRKVLRFYELILIHRKSSQIEENTIRKKLTVTKIW